MVGVRLSRASLFLAVLSVCLASGSRAQSPHVLAETAVRPSRVYIGEPFELRLRVLTKTWFTTGISLEDPRVPFGIVRRIGRSFTYTEPRDGQTYAVSERRYLIWTSQVGEVAVAPQKIRSESPPEGESKGVPVEVMSPEATVEVLPPPHEIDPASWMTAQSAVVQHQWSRALTDLMVGDAIGLEISVRAEGSVSALLKLPTLQEIPGLSLHAEPSTLQDEMGDQTNTAFRSDRWSILLQESGTFAVPELRVVWWNYATRSREETVIPSVTFTVAENPDLDPDLVSQPVTEQDSLVTARDSASWWPPSPRSVLIFCLVFVLLMFLLRFGRNRAQTTSERANLAEIPESTWFKRFQIAVADKNPQAVRRQFTFWLDRRVGAIRNHPETASGFASTAHDDQLRSNFGRLDEILYGNATEPSPDDIILGILDGVRNVRNATFVGASRSSKVDPDSLPPLNPER
jgi:hypothetical protein